MAGDTLRSLGDRVATPVGRALAAAGISANALTLSALPLVAGGAYLVATGRHLAGAAAFFAGSVTDLFDGAVARASGRQSAFGAFLDSVTDRVADALMLGAVAWWLARPDVMGPWGLGAGLAALSGAFLVSYVRARAEAAGFSAGVGLGERGVRVFLTVAGLVSGLLFEATVLLAALAIVTAGQRVAVVRSQSRVAGEGAGGLRRRGPS